MKKVLMIAVTALALLLFFTISGSAKDKTLTWTGWISDSHCGVKGMTATTKTARRNVSGEWVPNTCSLRLLRESHSDQQSRRG